MGKQDAVSFVIDYRAADARGRIVTGRFRASDLGEATSRLREQGLEPIHLSTTEKSSLAGRRIPIRQWTLFFRSLASLVEAGLPLDRALAASETLIGDKLRPEIAELRISVQGGSTFADALGAAGGRPPSTVLGIIRAGERGGQFGRTLLEVAEYLERESELLARVRQALAYPALLATVGTGTVLVIGAVILPRFASLIEDAGQSLPLATRMLLAGSRLLTRSGWWLLAGLGVCLAGAHAWWSRPYGRRRVDAWILAIPQFGSLIERLSGARVGRALGGMLQAGMPLLTALDGAALASGNGELEARLLRARSRVARGEPVAGALTREAALPSGVIPLIGLGEQTGQLGRMTQRAGDLSAQEAERTLGALVSVLEPVLILLFGALVAFVAAALLQAVYSLRPGS